MESFQRRITGASAGGGELEDQTLKHTSSAVSFGKLKLDYARISLRLYCIVNYPGCYTRTYLPTTLLYCYLLRV